MSIRRLTLGAGYRYLMSSVARMDEATRASGLTAYYAAKGTPPGRFLGKGLGGLDNRRGVAPGAEVSEDHLWRLIGMLQDPITGEALGRAPAPVRPAFIDENGRLHSASRPVAGFDLTFSAPKSVSVAWALADEVTRARIHAAHRRALEVVIRYAERRVFATRTGAAGAVSEDINGVVAAAFDHWDSRSGDPQLHTHVVVVNRVQAVGDLRWRTLDSKALFRSAVGLSELYNGVLADLLTADLGWGWASEKRRRSPEPKWEVAGVNVALREEFSKRSAMIEDAKEDLVTAFVATRGRQPTATEILRMRQQATLVTRPTKEHRSLNEVVIDWRARAAAYLPDQSEPLAQATPHEPIGVSFVAGLANRNDLPVLRSDDIVDGMLKDTARSVLATVSDKRATFTSANLFAESVRQLHGIRFATPGDRISVAERTTTFATDYAVRLTPPDPLALPEELRRDDGTSRLRPRNSAVYSTRDIIDAEERLLLASRAMNASSVPAPSAHALVAASSGEGPQLSADQAAAVAAIVSSGRRLDVLVGAAGTGKSTTMAGLRAVWEAAYGPGSDVGLAPSASAAEVLGEAVGIPTENTAKWLLEASANPQREAELDGLLERLRRASPSVSTRAMKAQAQRVHDELTRWRLREGQLLIVDEASIAGTRELDQIVALAGRARTKVLLVGDWAQLSAVSAGGAFRLVATDRSDAPQLHDVRRFRHDWEGAATLRVRAGEAAVVGEYVDRGRVASGDREAMLDALFAAWRDDVGAGQRSLMVAVEGGTVRELNKRVRADRMAAGRVSGDGVEIADGLVAGVGDQVVTRLNQRDLTAGSTWVKNGDVWTVTGLDRDGSLVVAARGRGQVRLPPSYVAEHVELGYATTAHRAQGRTVDRTHAFIDIGTTQEALYVMATRGRSSNMMYVDTALDRNLTDEGPPAEHADVAEVLAHALQTSEAELSAHETGAALMALQLDHAPKRTSELAHPTGWRSAGVEHLAPSFRS